MKRLLRLVLLSAMLNAPSAFAGSEQQEIDQYITIFEGGVIGQQLDVCNELQWSGISDMRLFDVIESKLLAILQAPGEGDKRSTDLASWYAKALGTSGQDKYRGTLDKMASGALVSKELHPKLLKKQMKYGKEGLDMLPRYKKWNQIISDQKNFRSDKPLRVNRFANMLRSDQWELQLIATKRMNYEKYNDSYLLDMLNDKVRKGYPAMNNIHDKERIDAFQWMIRSLGGLGAPKYLETLQEIVSKSSNKGIVSFTKKVIKKNY